MEAEQDYIRAFPKAERRFFVTGIEVRKGNSPEEPRTFRGYGAVFNSLSEDLGGFREKISPTFFDKVLGNDVRILRDHTPSMILGRTSAGTGKVGVDEKGLWYEWTDPGTSYSRDLTISIDRGDVNQSSFAFSIADNGDVWERQKDGSYIRTLLECDGLHDCSPVTYPAYSDTSVAKRSLQKLQIPDGIAVAEDLYKMDRHLMKRDLKKIKI